MLKYIILKVIERKKELLKKVSFKMIIHKIFTAAFFSLIIVSAIYGFKVFLITDRKRLKLVREATEYLLGITEISWLKYFIITFIIICIIVL